MFLIGIGSDKGAENEDEHEDILDAAPARHCYSLAVYLPGHTSPVTSQSDGSKLTSSLSPLVKHRIHSSINLQIVESEIVPLACVPVLLASSTEYSVQVNAFCCPKGAESTTEFELKVWMFRGGQQVDWSSIHFVLSRAWSRCRGW